MADKSKHTINYAKVAEEAQLDGFYGVYTNLESTIEEIIAINRRRWEIEETFRILKSEMWTRPVYLEGRKNPDSFFDVFPFITGLSRFRENN